MRKCPNCGSENVSSERRPNGLHRCLECKYEGNTFFFDQLSTDVPSNKSSCPYKVTTTLEQLLHFLNGPIWDGNLISKDSRDKLYDAELIEKPLDGFQSITPKGMVVLDILGYLKHG